MLNQSITVLGMILGMAIVFLAYREGIKTGLSMQSEKVPPITPKGIKKEQERQDFEQEQGEKEAIYTDELLKDVNEAMDLSRMYEGGDK